MDKEIEAEEIWLLVSVILIHPCLWLLNSAAYQKDEVDPQMSYVQDQMAILRVHGQDSLWQPLTQLYTIVQKQYQTVKGSPGL